MIKRQISVVILLFALLVPYAAFGQQPVYPANNPNDPVTRIKDEGMNHSQVMQTLSYLSDVIGPRLTASPNAKRANEWTRSTLEKWGLQNAHLEAWGPFGRGWTLKRFSAQVVEPQDIPLIAYPKAWSPGIKVMSTTATSDPKSKRRTVAATLEPASVVRSPRIFTAISGSIPAVGSSRINTGGSPTSACAKTTR